MKIRYEEEEPFLNRGTLYGMIFLLAVGFIIGLSVPFAKGQTAYSPVQTNSVTWDTIPVFMPEGDTLNIILHSADSVDTNHIMMFGYTRGQAAWYARFSSGWREEGMSPTVLMLENEHYRYDVNRDGYVNVGDVVSLIRYIFPQSE